jgi:hypothetical protein
MGLDLLGPMIPFFNPIVFHFGMGVFVLCLSGRCILEADNLPGSQVHRWRGTLPQDGSDPSDSDGVGDEI